MIRTPLRAALIYLVALINIGSTLLPIWPRRYLLLTSFVPVDAALLANHLTLFAGIAMLLLAYPAASGHRRAANLLMLCALVAIVMNVLKGLDVEEAVVNLALLVGLWCARGRLRRAPIRYTVVDLARLGVAMFAIWRVYLLSGRGILAIIRRAEKRMSVGPVATARQAWLKSTLTAHLHLERIFLYQSRFALPLFLVIVFVIISWRALADVELTPVPDDLYWRYGRSARNSLAYLANRGDTLTFFASEGRGAISYKLVGRVALQIGAILGPASERARVYAEFRDWLRHEGLIPAAVALTPEERTIAESTGMRSLPIGREAVVGLGAFGLDRLNKKMRWAQRSLAKRGYRCELLRGDEITGALRTALARIDYEWRERRGGQSYGCCMTLGRFPGARDAECRVGVLRDPDGAPVAYLTLLPGGEGAYSLDLTRRLRSAPNAAMEVLLTETLLALREAHAIEVSLNFSTFSGIPRRVGGKALARLGSLAFQTDSLETFNNKFLPGWTPRYLALRSWFDLPDVIYAILVIEGADRAIYNAFVRGLRRVRDWWLPSTAGIAEQPAPSLSGEGR